MRNLFTADLYILRTRGRAKFYFAVHGSVTLEDAADFRPRYFEVHRIHRCVIDCSRDNLVQISLIQRDDRRLNRNRRRGRPRETSAFGDASVCQEIQENEYTRGEKGHERDNTCTQEISRASR
jgi:hypothetical protein